MPLIPDSIATAATLDGALEATLQHFAADSGTVHLLEPDGLLHLKAASRGIPEVAVERFRLIPVGKGMAGLAVERAQPVTACNIQTDGSGDVRPGAKLTGLEGAIVVPMLRDNHAIGAFGIANRAERTFTEGEQTLLLAIAAHLAAKYG
jgi:GAF domain-containing protein